MKHATFGIAGIILLVAGLAVAPARVHASPGAQSPPAPHERHCVANVAPAGVNLSNWNPDVRCFDTFSEAISAATGGRVNLPPDFHAGDLTPELLDSLLAASPPPASTGATPAFSTVVGIDWEYINFQGITYTWTTDHTAGCTDGTNYITPSMPSGWDNIVSSARGYQGCNTYIHYEDPSYGGAQINCDGGSKCATMGVMDNQTSSERWQP